MRIVIDTNILLASIGSSAPYRWLLDAVLAGHCCLLVTTEILLEYGEIIGNRTRPLIAHNIVQSLLNTPFTERITVYYRWNLITSDPDDNKFIDCAVGGDADYLITHDKDFAVLKEISFPHVQSISPEDFRSIFMQAIQ